jgi:glycosyltransferase involved in cell wall biosynthesis
VFSSFEPGGTERQMIELVRRLDPRRWTVHVACFQARGTWFGRAADAAASIAVFPVVTFRKPGVLTHAAAFARWCRLHRILVVHTTGLPSNVFALPSAAYGGVPVRIGNRREINPDKSPLEIGVQRAAYTFAHRIVANSRAAADRLIRERVPARKIAIVPNGLDAARFAARPAAGSLRRVVMVANLRREKGHDVLIEAAGLVLQRFPDARFEIVGGGPERQALEARAAARRVLHAFSFLGHCEDVAGRLAAADIFVLPSRSEAFPNAVLEAMAAGLPVVASGVGGVVELLDEGRTGMLVPPDDPGSLADRLGALMADSAVGARLGSAARAHAQNYSFDCMVDAFEDIYLSELARRGISRAGQPQLVTS